MTVFKQSYILLCTSIIIFFISYLTHLIIWHFFSYWFLYRLYDMDSLYSRFSQIRFRFAWPPPEFNHTSPVMYELTSATYCFHWDSSRITASLHHIQLFRRSRTFSFTHVLVLLRTNANHFQFDLCPGGKFPPPLCYELRYRTTTLMPIYHFM